MTGLTCLTGLTGLTVAPGSHLTVSTGLTDVGGGGELPVVSADAAVHVSCGPVSSLSGLPPLSRPGEQVSGSLETEEETPVNPLLAAIGAHQEGKRLERALHDFDFPASV